MAETYTAAEVREIVGLLLADADARREASATASDAVRRLLAIPEGELRHWGAFKEVFAFAYDPDTLEVSAVERTDVFLGDPTADLLNALAGRRDGLSVEVWGVRHPWAAWCGDRSVGPECLQSFGRRPAWPERIEEVVEAAMEFDAKPPAPR